MMLKMPTQDRSPGQLSRMVIAVKKGDTGLIVFADCIGPRMSMPAATLLWQEWRHLFRR